MNTHIRGKCCVCEKPADAIFERLYCAGCALKRQTRDHVGHGHPYRSVSMSVRNGREKMSDLNQDNRE
jgi:hypothetical protein